MACPTCDHTMKAVAVIETTVSLFWCQRCGTIKRTDDEGDRPKLVDRVVKFAGTLTDDDADVIERFERCGVRESSTHPDVRF